MHFPAPAYTPQAGWLGMAAHDEAEEVRAAAELQTAEAQLQLATAELNVKKQRVQQGLAPANEASAAEADYVRSRSAVQSAQVQLGQARQQRQRSARMADLQRPIDVELRSATVKDAARSISQASGMPVEVDPAVSSETRLSVVARGVPMATILDSIARQAGLLIYPQENGVALKPAPALEVNGQRIEYLTPFAPWSSEWGTNPASSVGYGGYRTLTGALQSAGDPRDYRVQLSPGEGLAPSTPAAPGSAGSGQGLLRSTPPSAATAPGGLSLAPAAPSAAAPQVSQPPATSVYLDREGLAISAPMAGSTPRLLIPDGAPSSVALASLGGSSFVLAHPSTTPEGQPAVMLTVYRLDGNRIHVISTTLHPLGQHGDRLSVPLELNPMRPGSLPPVQPKAGNPPKPTPSAAPPSAR
jgi:hypothetical protein